MGSARPRLDRGVLLALVAMGLAILVLANDFTALSVALPSIERQFGADVTTVQWVINGYALVFGVLIVTGGRLADMFGRKRIFAVGSTIFAVFSLIGGMAPNIAMLLAARALMGIGGAMMWPAILGMTYAILPATKAGLAGGVILGTAGFGNAMGPLLGGFLTDTFSWRWIFFVNLPLAALAALVTWRTIRLPQSAAGERKLDYGGIAALSLALLALLLALDQGTDLGWSDPRIVALFVVSVVLLTAFAFIERGMRGRALVPPAVMGNRSFAAAGFAVLLMSAIFFAALVYLPQFMQKSLGYSPLQAGAGLLPMMATFAVVSFLAGPLYGRWGPKRIVSLGAALLALGVLLLSLMTPSSGYPVIIPGMLVLGLGVGFFYSSITTAGVTALDPKESSLAGAVIYMFQIAGGSLGLGLNTAIVTVSPSLVDGIRTAFRVDGALGLGGLVISLLLVGGAVHRERLRSLRGHYRAHL